MIDLVLINKTRFRISLLWLENQTRLLLKKIRLGPPVSLSLVIISDAEMRQLNWSYRRQKKVTDVLSFDLRRPNMPGISGEIFLCFSEAAVIARERHVCLRRALLWLIIHGILHLAGFEHDQVPLEQAKRMFLLQDKLARDFHV